MDYLKIVMFSVISLIVLFILAKLIGNRQLSELTVFDYINGITIGSIAAEMATGLEKHWTKPMLAMVIYGSATALISYICCKSVKMRRFFNGRAIILYDKGKFRYDGLKRARLDINEFLTQCRTAGYFDVAQIQTAIMEQNGKISFLPKADSRPVEPKDMALNVPDDSLLVNVIVDGKILEENLLGIGFDKKWLISRMSQSNAGPIDGIMLATVDGSGTATFYKKYVSHTKNDVFL